MPADASHAEQIFHEALKRANQMDRHVFLSAACGNDTSLWNEVWDRLQNHNGVLLSARKTRGLKTRSVPLQTAAHEKPNDLIGSHRLVKIIGEGSASTVWMAEECSTAALVALKIMQADAQDFTRRYERQRPVLGLLDHPNIAKTYACGTAPSGKPFVVMELLHAVPITQFCDDQKLPLLARVQLFLQACDAIHHAHQKGMVHGGIKPANLLLQWDEAGGEPVLKVMDFGIAKALDHAPAGPDGKLRAPPAYFSPEHGRAGRIDERSDIYALGMLLYELLTGRLPLVEEQAGLLKPSACLQTLPKAQLTGIALSRQVEVTKIAFMLEYHFDWIVMRALEKQPTNRYATVSALVNDLQHYLALEPVIEETATGANAKARGFMRRCRSVLQMAALVTLTLAGTFALTSWLLVLQRRANELKEASKTPETQLLAEQAQEALLKKLFADDTALPQSLKAAATAALEPLTEQNQPAAELQEKIALNYLALSQPADAQTQFEAALEKQRMAVGPEHPDTLRTMKNLATALHAQGREVEAELRLRQTLGTQQRVLGAEHRDTLVTINVLAAVCEAQGKHLDAETLYLQLYQVQQRVLGPDHLETLAAMSNLAKSFTAQGKFEDAMKLRGEHLEGMQRTLGTKHPQTLVAMTLTAEAYEAGGKPSEAETMYLGALEIMQQALGTEHPDTLAQVDEVALMHGRHGRHAEALKLHQQNLEAKQRVFGAEPPQTLLTMKHLADEYEANDQRAEAEATQLDVLKILQATCGPEHPDTLAHMESVAEVFGRSGKHDAATLALEQVLEVKQRKLGEHHPQTHRAMQQLARAYDASGRRAEAEALQLKALEATNAAFGPGDPDTLAQMQAMAVMYQRHGKPVEAGQMYLQMLPIQQRALGPGHADTIDTMNGLAATYQQQGRLPDAEKLYQQVLEIQRQAEEPQALAEAAIQLGGCWLRAGKFAEAETMLRTGLGLRIEHSPEHWRRFQAESLLGAALLGQKSLAAAEPLLRSGYAGLYARADAIPDESKHQLRDAIERLAQFAEVAGDVAQVAEWRQRMVEFDHARQVADR